MVSVTLGKLNYDQLSDRLNRLLESEGIAAKVSLNEGCLRVILESGAVPDRSASVKLVYRNLRALGYRSPQPVQVYGWKLGEDCPAWGQELNCNEPIRLRSGSDKPVGGKNILATLQTFRFAAVVPYRDALNPELYRSHTVQLLPFFSLFPWAVSLFAGNAGLQNTAWILGVYAAAIWGIVLYNLIKTTYFSWSNVLKCSLFTAFIGIPLLLIVQRFPPFNILYAAVTDSGERLGPIARILGFVFGVGVLEESCKALPVYLFLSRLPR